MSLTAEELCQFDVAGLSVLRGVTDVDLIDRARVALGRIEGLTTAELPEGCFATWTPVLDEYSIINVLEADPIFLELIDQPEVLRWIDALIPPPNRLVEAFTNSRRSGPGLPLHAISTAITGRGRAGHAPTTSPPSP